MPPPPACVPLRSGPALRGEAAVAGKTPPVDAGLGLLAASDPSQGAKSQGCSSTSEEEPCRWLPAALPPRPPDLDGRAYTFFVVEYAGEFCWIVSEATWILLIPWACLVTGALAFFLLGAVAVRTYVTTGGKRQALWLPQAIQAYWLLTNFVWMSEEVLWDSPDQPTPWNLTPMAGRDADVYEEVNFCCVCSFLVAPVVWLVALAWVACRECAGSRRSGEGLSLRACSPACGLFCQAGFIASWALMDGLWAAGLLWPSIASCVLTIAMIAANAAWETGRGLRGFDRTDLVWVLWTLANLVWIVVELAADDNLTLRFISAAVAFASLAVLGCSWRQAQARVGLRAAHTAGAESGGGCRTAEPGGPGV